MTQLKKSMIFVSFLPENWEIFVNGVLDSESCEDGLSHNFIRHKEYEAERMGLFDRHKELFLRTWASRAYELNGDYYDAAMCYDRTATVAWALKLYGYRATFLQHCYRCHLNTDKPERFENASYALLKVASSINRSRLEKLRLISLAELGFLCAGIDFKSVQLTAKVLRDIKHFEINDIVHDLLAKRIPIEHDDERELFMREVLFSAEELHHGFYTKLRRISEMKGVDQITRMIASTFLGRHYEAARQNIPAGTSYQNAAINNTHFLPRTNQELILRTAANYIREGAYNPALNALQKAQPMVNQTAPDFSEAFQNRIREIETDTQNLYK